MGCFWSHDCWCYTETITILWKQFLILYNVATGSGLCWAIITKIRWTIVPGIYWIRIALDRFDNCWGHRKWVCWRILIILLCWAWWVRLISIIIWYNSNTIIIIEIFDIYIFILWKWRCISNLLIDCVVNWIGILINIDNFWW